LPLGLLLAHPQGSPDQVEVAHLGAGHLLLVHAGGLGRDEMRSPARLGRRQDGLELGEAGGDTVLRLSGFILTRGSRAGLRLSTNPP
jgi:hypothetical protein